MIASRRTAPVPTGGRRMAGFTLIELAIVAVLAGLLAAIAVPTWSGHLARARRSDAVSALLRVQAAQEQYRNTHGLYAHQLSALTGAAATRSAEGFYDIRLLDAGPEGYRAAARARADGPQAADTDCRELRLEVRLGLASQAPSRRCWNL